MRSYRLATIAGAAAMAALLSACASRPVVVNSYPQISTPASTVVQVPVAAVEYGRITNIEYFQAGAARPGVNVPGAVVGGIIGAAAGNAISGGRDAATVLGGVAGAAVGSQVGRTDTVPVYRITIQSETAGWRTFDVPATGDLRIGDRVRVDNGVIYRA